MGEQQSGSGLETYSSGGSHCDTRVCFFGRRTEKNWSQRSEILRLDWDGRGREMLLVAGGTLTLAAVRETRRFAVIVGLGRASHLIQITC